MKNNFIQFIRVQNLRTNVRFFSYFLRDVKAGIVILFYKAIFFPICVHFYFADNVLHYVTFNNFWISAYFRSTDFKDFLSERGSLQRTLKFIEFLIGLHINEKHFALDLQIYNNKDLLNNLNYPEKHVVTFERFTLAYYF